MDTETIYAFVIAGLAGLTVIGFYYLINFIG